MGRLRCVRSCIFVLALCTFSALGPQRIIADPALPAIHTGPIVWVSKANAQLDHAEMLAAADPTNPARMLACTSAFLNGRNARVDIVYATFDGGATWRQAFEHHSTRYVGDPACAYGLNGTAWLTSLALFEGAHERNSLRVFQSRDNGATWGFVTQRGFMDREYVTVDRTGGRYNGRVYIYAHDVVPEKHKKGHKSVAEPRESVQLMVMDRGKVQPPVHFSNYRDFTAAIPLEGVITPRGTLVIPFAGNTTHAKLFVTTSRDGGHSLTKASAVAGFKECPRAIFLLAPAAVDKSRGPFRGRIYLTWTDSSSGRCLTNVAHSDNEGTSWSMPITLHDDNASTSGGGPDELLPTIAVNKNGIVGLSWYDTRDDAKNKSMQLRFAMSDDGGQSFGPSVPLSDGHYDGNNTKPAFLRAESYGYNGDLGTNVESHDESEYQDIPGHTRDMIANADGTFRPFWFENNQDGVPRLLTEAIRVTGRAWRNGDPSLEGLHDVTGKVSLRYRFVRFDPQTDTMTLNAVLVNRSKSKIAGPVKMRLLWAESHNGRPAAVNASNGVTGPGAVWDMSSALSGGTLKAWSESRPLTLTFDMHTRSAKNPPLPQLTFESRVVAGSK